MRALPGTNLISERWKDNAQVIRHLASSSFVPAGFSISAATEAARLVGALKADSQQLRRGLRLPEILLLKSAVGEVANGL